MNDYSNDIPDDYILLIDIIPFELSRCTTSAGAGYFYKFYTVDEKECRYQGLLLTLT